MERAGHTLVTLTMQINDAVHSGPPTIACSLG